jgi:PAS domain S-box-containing protein
MLGLALAYGLLSAFALRQGGEPVAVFPAAGVALGCVLAYGYGVLPGVALGALGAHAALLAQHGGWEALQQQGLLLPLGLAAAKTLHAALGAWLLRRFAPGPLLLDSARAIVRFTGLAALACAGGAAAGAAVLWLNGSAAAPRLPATWALWWLGDTTGTLIVTPLVLALLAEPRAHWRPRLKSYALPMLVLGALALAAVSQVTGWDDARVQQELVRETERVTASVQRGLQEPAMSLRIAALNLGRTDIVEIIALDEAVRLWGAVPPHLLSSGWAPLGHGDAQQPPSLRTRAEVAHASPPVLTETDLWQLPDAPQRLRRAAERSAGVATLGPLPDARLVIAQPVLDPGARFAATRWSRATGVLFVTLSGERLLADALKGATPGLFVCLLDGGEPAGAPRVLAGPARCSSPAAAAPPMQSESATGLPGSSWFVRVVAAPAYLRAHRSWIALALTQMSLFAVYAIGMFLLVVTSRAQRDTARAERSEALIDEMFAAAPFGIALLAPDGRYMRVNAAFAQLTGYAQAELLGMSFRDITHPDDHPSDTQRAKALLAGEAVRAGLEKRYIRKDGSVVHVRVQNAVKRDADGQLSAILAVVEDVTERRRVAELEQSTRRAEAANRAKNEFLSRMSHELRTPLNAMLGFAQLLRRDRAETLSQAQRERVSLIERSGWHLLSMIEDVLDLSHIESGTVRLSMEPVLLAPLLQDAASMHSVEAARAQVVMVEPDIAPDATTVRSDATRLRQVMSNLLSNAIKYNRPGGRVDVTARREGDGRVAIAVRDNGMGLSESQLAQLYEPFNRLGRELSGKPGTGIGLAITRRLVELMEGELQVSSEPARGSVFTVLLAAAQRPRVPPVDATAPPQAHYGPARLLYIEDNALNAELMSALLAHRPQLSLLVCGNGAEGLNVLRSDPRIDLVLLDMHLPDTDGLQLLRQIRNEPESAGIPVIAVSADALAERVQAALRAGAAAYITKPLELDETLHAIDRALLRRTHAASPEHGSE